MTEEEKVIEEKKECNCVCHSELGKFFTQTASIFLGVLLAILVAAALLKPNCPCHKNMMPPIGIHRQMPQMGQFGPGKHFKGHKHHPGRNLDRNGFDAQKFPEKNVQADR